MRHLGKSIFLLKQIRNIKILFSERWSAQRRWATPRFKDKCFFYFSPDLMRWNRRGLEGKKKKENALKANALLRSPAKYKYQCITVRAYKYNYERMQQQSKRTEKFIDRFKQTHSKLNPTMRQILFKVCYKCYYNDLKIKKRSYQVCRRHRSHKWGIHWLATYLQLSYLDSIHSNLKFLRFKFTMFFRGSDTLMDSIH